MNAHPLSARAQCAFIRDFPRQLALFTQGFSFITGAVILFFVCAGWVS